LSSEATRHRILDGRTALITAGSKGIGAAITSAFVAAGARVVVTGRSPDALAALEAEHGSDRVCGVVGSADDDRHRDAAVALAVSTFGSLDVLVNNVGSALVAQPLMETSLDTFRAAVNIGVVAHLAWTQAAWRAYLREHGGAVLNIASIAGLSVVPNVNPYTVEKAAVIQLTRQLALELAPAVRVNALAPGFIRSERTRSVLATNEDAVAKGVPMGRVGEGADIAAAATFLASDAASFITGHTLVVDGGKLLLRG
jgi:NAD(P)-dependent dehydrogenase (short-subunit alcohol dehydrogenase family)